MTFLAKNYRMGQNKILVFLGELLSKTYKTTFLKFCRIFQNFAEFFSRIGRKTLFGPGNSAALPTNIHSMCGGSISAHQLPTQQSVRISAVFG